MSSLQRGGSRTLAAARDRHATWQPPRPWWPDRRI